MPETYEHLRAEAERRQTDVNHLIREAVEDYLTGLGDQDELEDTPKEKVLEDLRVAWREAQTGQTIPADEALADLRKKLADESDQD